MMDHDRLADLHRTGLVYPARHQAASPTVVHLTRYELPLDGDDPIGTAPALCGLLVTHRALTHTDEEPAEDPGAMGHDGTYNCHTCRQQRTGLLVTPTFDPAGQRFHDLHPDAP